ncbi:methyl-accepting chemotaxis protein [Myxococcaceae bacterium GXIMD 01537]
MSFLAGLKLRGRLTAAVALLVLVAMLPLVLLGLSYMREQMQKQIHATLAVEAEGLRDLIEASLTEREAGTRGWAEDAILRGALLFDTYDKSDGVLRSLHERHPSFAGLVLLTEDGRAVSVSDPRLREVFSGRQAEVLATGWFQAALAGRLDASALTRVDPFFGRRVLPLAVPVLSPISGSRIGVLLAAFDWERVGAVVGSAVERARARAQQSFALEVLGADGALLYSSREAGVPAPAEVVQESAGDEAAVKDVGDGWRFVATVDAREAYAPVTRAARVAYLLLAVFLGLAFVGAWWVARGVTQPLTSLGDVVARVVRDGDLTQRVEVRSERDEVGALAAAFARMMDHLRESTTSLQQGTQVLTRTVGELTEASNQQERNVSKQAAALTETQVTAQEIKQTSMMAAERSHAVLGVASRAREVGQAGEATVAASLEGFEHLRAQVGRMAASISALNERTQQIGGITQTVKDLADQSNMLALNASIEAVRSGEHGRGFTVVAREIRSLADQSIDSTGRVRELLEDIRQGIHTTVELSEEGQRRTEAGLNQVRASGESLRELAGIIQDNAAAAQQIAAAVSQQNAGIAQIFTAVTDLSQMMDETLHGLRATQRTTDALRDVARRMEKVASTYRV